jgi:hypothetical protein
MTIQTVSRTRTTLSRCATSTAPSSEPLVAGACVGGAWWNSAVTVLDITDGAHVGVGPGAEDIIISQLSSGGAGWVVAETVSEAERVGWIYSSEWSVGGDCSFCCRVFA